MSKIKSNTTLILIFLFSLIAISGAYFIEYVSGHQPCNLCLLERIPYFLAIIIIALIFFLKKYQKKFLVLLSIIFICSTALSLYHFGIEQGFIEESFVCNLSSLSNNLTAEDILEELKNSPISCKNVTFRLFGFSLATINAIISAIISIITIKLNLNNEIVR